MNESPKNKFLIDGFPRNKDNLDGWNNMMTGKVNVMGVLFFDCPEDVRHFDLKKFKFLVDFYCDHVHTLKFCNILRHFLF